MEAVDFGDYRDGAIEYGLPLRRDIARAIRRYRPSSPSCGFLGGGVRRRHGQPGRPPGSGLAALDAVRDAGNRWLHTDLARRRPRAVGGVKAIAVAGSASPTHFVDVSGEHFEASVHSLEAHEAYNAALPPEFPTPRQPLGMIRGGGARPPASSTPRSFDVIQRG